MTRLRLSKNFTIEEFDCRDGTPVPPELILNIRLLVATILQPLRDALGEPVCILSGYRSEAHNKAVGGVKNSQHLFGKAADIAVKSKTPKQLARLIEKWIDPRGMGVYSGFVHVDIRSGKRARW